ncbi:hypothetical protein ABZT06_26125 [Streptomyces sp. NPDC005483]|uniref:hypothetical protein n=1 Tax=Streptomyces sp. NPDC005483 TaxID=3154882 RepID=UPI0033BA4E47
MKAGFLGTPPVADLHAYAVFTEQPVVHPPSPGPVSPRSMPSPARAAGRRVGVDGLITDRPDVVRDALRE